MNKSQPSPAKEISFGLLRDRAIGSLFAPLEFLLEALRVFTVRAHVMSSEGPWY